MQINISKNINHKLSTFKKKNKNLQPLNFLIKKKDL
jgi:hypothetical protein